MAAAVIREVVATASVHKQGFGGLLHSINHAAGIIELERYGYVDVAEKALVAHHRHLRLWRSQPDVSDELWPVAKSSLPPSDPAYWDGMLKRDQARLTHRIKTIYDYEVVRSVTQEPDLLSAANDAFLYLMD